MTVGSRVPGRRAPVVASAADEDERPRLPGPTRRGGAAQASVKLGEVSRGRQALTVVSLALGNEATLRTLQEKRPAAGTRPLPEEVLACQPAEPLALPLKLFAECRKSSPRRSAPGRTFEQLRVLLDGETSLEKLHSAAQDFARAGVAAKVAEAYMQARLTALPKPPGGARRYAGWWPGLWPGSFGPRWPTSSPCLQGRGRTVPDMLFGS